MNNAFTKKTRKGCLVHCPVLSMVWKEREKLR